MKKAILSILAVTGLSSWGFSQGVITFDESEAVGPKVFYSPGIGGGEMPDLTIDINAELLYWTGTNYAPVVTLLLSVTDGPDGEFVPIGAVVPAYGDITAFADGILYDLSGNAYQFPSIPAGTVVTFIVEGWMGNYSSYAAAQSTFEPYGCTYPFQETLSDPGSPIPANISNMPDLPMVLIPEPGTMALASLGFGALLMLGYRERSTAIIQFPPTLV